MDKYNEALAKINEQIEQLDKELDKIQADLIENENKQDLGLISIVDNALKMELLLDKDLFNDEDMKELEEIVNKLQELIIKVCERQRG